VSSGLKVCLLGQSHSGLYEDAMAKGFERLGCSVRVVKLRFDLDTVCRSIQRTRLSPFLLRINKKAVADVIDFAPDLLIVWRADLLLASSIEEFRRQMPEIKMVCYHNDDPYSRFVFRLKNRHYLDSIKKFDACMIYRPSDLRWAQKYQGKNVSLLLPSYISDLHYERDSLITHNLSFIGHFEKDQRIDVLEACFNAGLNVNIKGPGWSQVKSQYKFLRDKDVSPVFGEDYVNSISSSLGCFGFLSSRHNDVYTRRCFEIPACGSLLIAPRTKELQDIFTDNKNALLYSSVDDLVPRLKSLLATRREVLLQMRKAGTDLIRNGGHDEAARAQQVLNVAFDV
jgi:hypothetical protein